MNPVRRLREHRDAWSGQIGANEVFLFVTGIGPREAESSAGVALKLGESVDQSPNGQIKRPDAVLVVGLCGSLDASIGETAVVSYSGCLSTDENKARVSCSPSLTGQIVSLLNSRGFDCRSIVGISSLRVATSKAEKLQLATSGAHVVDMESYQIVSAANQAQIPVAVIRVVFDSLDREVPDFDRSLNASGGISSLKAARIFLGSPITTLKLLLISRSSTQRLKQALGVILPAGVFGSTGS
jgi:nucleoside phosphorylase